MVDVLWLFPTCVGMNRMHPARSLQMSPVPHVRGDEPPLQQV